jgi:hypothetical protein
MTLISGIDALQLSLTSRRRARRWVSLSKIAFPFDAAAAVGDTLGGLRAIVQETDIRRFHFSQLSGTSKERIIQDGLLPLFPCTKSVVKDMRNVHVVNPTRALKNSTLPQEIELGNLSFSVASVEVLYRS